MPTTFTGSEMTPIYGLTSDNDKKTARDMRAPCRASWFTTPSCATGCETTKRLGAWLTVRVNGGPIGPDLLDVLAPGYVDACSPIAHCDAVELVRLLLAAGQRSDAASVTALLEKEASATPGFPGLPRRRPPRPRTSRP